MRRPVHCRPVLLVTTVAGLTLLLAGCAGTGSTGAAGSGRAAAPRPTQVSGAGGSPVALLLYVDDVDSTFARALTAGAKQVRAVANQFYGDRSGTLIDPFGHIWTISTHVEDVPLEELRRRMAAMGGSCGESA